METLSVLKITFMWRPGGFLRSLRNSSPEARSLPLHAACHRPRGGTPRPKGSCSWDLTG